MSPESPRRIFVAGADHLLGRAFVEVLTGRPEYLLADDRGGQPEPTSAEAVARRLREFQPDFVVVAAGECGGIGRNRREPATLMLHNLQVAVAYLGAARQLPIKKLLYLSSSCTYPRLAPQPMTPAALGTGPLEPTSAPYAQAKLAGMALCQACRAEFGTPAIVAIPSGPFGPGDSFDPDNAHVVGALIRRLHLAKAAGDASVTIWGSGQARRDFIYAQDVALAGLHLLEHYDAAEVVNIASGSHYSIAELASTIKEVVGYAGELVYDRSQPDGAPLKALDASPLRQLGWQPRWELRPALQATYRWYLAHA